MSQKFYFPKIKMQSEPIFLQVLWQFLSARRSRPCGFARGALLAACGGENRPNYFKNRPHFRKPQGVGNRLALLGDCLLLAISCLVGAIRIELMLFAM